MAKRNIKEYDKSYHPPETLYLNYCAAVLAVVLKHHPKAEELYENIKDCMLLPGVQDTFKFIEQKIPGSGKLIEGIATNAGYKKGSKPENNSAITARRLVKGFTKLITNLKSRFYLWIVISNRRRRDLRALAGSIDTFIRVCFNRESDRAKGVYHVTCRTSETLAMLVMVKALLETNEKYKGIFTKMGRIPMLKHGEKIFSVETALDWKMPALARRSLISQYVEAGFKRKHGKVIETSAWRWYQCRVVHEGPTEYYHKQLKQTTIEDMAVVEPENLLHELEEFDKALGYTRGKTGKRKY